VEKGKITFSAYREFRSIGTFRKKRYLVLDAECVDSSCCHHASDCAVHNAPALPVGPCDCDGWVLELP
jgi:hypothetical protein